MIVFGGSPRQRGSLRRRRLAGPLPHVRSAARAAYPGPKGMVLPDSCQQAFQDEVNPSAEDAAALAASILIIEATTGVQE